MFRKLKKIITAAPIRWLWQHKGRRAGAVGLCISMIFGNVVSMAAATSGASSSIAADTGVTCFELDGAVLYKALQKAIKEKKAVDKYFDFRGEGAEDYDSLFEPAGELYELKPKFNKDSKYLNLRIFARLEQNIESGSRYRIEDYEEFIFLLTNSSHKERTAVISVDGKVTEQIVVIPYGEVELAEGVKAVETTPAIPESVLEDGSKNVRQPSEKTTEETEPLIPEEEIEETQETTEAEQETEIPEQGRTSVEDAQKHSNGGKDSVPDNEESIVNEDSVSDSTESGEIESKLSEGGESNLENNASDEEESRVKEVSVGDGLATISRHQTVVLTMSASPSDAISEETEDKKASPSEISSPEEDEKERLEGDVYQAVAMGEKAAVAFLTTAEELGLSKQDWNLATPAQAKHLYEADLGDVIIQAYVMEGVLPEEAELHAVKLEENGENAVEYFEAKDVLDDGGAKYDGMLAYDISFLDMEGNEIEPDGDVQVRIRLNSTVLPEETDPESIVVQHLAERAEGVKVETVADAMEETPGDIEVNEVETIADFQVESFSKFVITWTGYGSSVEAVTYLSSTKEELNLGPDKQINLSYGNAIKFAEQSDIKNVTYDGITYNYDHAELYKKANRSYTKKADINAIQAQYGYKNYRYYYTYMGWEYEEVIQGDIQIRLYYKEAPRSGEEINFYYTSKNEIDNAGSITRIRDASYMRYTIVLRDENGEEYLEDYLRNNKAAEENHPAEYKFKTKDLDIGPAFIAAMGISIPGYSFTEGYAYFYYDGYWSNSGNYVKVSNLLNYGAPADAGNRFDSNLAYTGMRYYQGGWSQDIKDMPGDYRNTEGGYYSYNPTGTLRLVFCKVSEKNKYHVNYVDAFSTSPNEKTVHQEEMDGPNWDEEEEIYYGTVRSIWQGRPEEDRKGYVFSGWYKEKNTDGNGMGDLAQTDANEGKRYKTDVTYYARWVPKEKSIRVEKKVAGNAGDRSKEFEFTIKINDKLVKSGTYGSVTVKEGTFVLTDGQSVTFDNLKYGDKVVIEESNYKFWGYETGYEAFDSDKKGNGFHNGSVWNVDSLDDVCTVVFTNTKNIATPTGVFTNQLPYLLIFTGAVCGGLWFLLEGLGRRRRTRNEFS